jgi:hypothetical protein
MKTSLLKIYYWVDDEFLLAPNYKDKLFDMINSDEKNLLILHMKITKSKYQNLNYQ